MNKGAGEVLNKCWPCQLNCYSKFMGMVWIYNRSTCMFTERISVISGVAQIFKFFVLKIHYNMKSILEWLRKVLYKYKVLSSLNHRLWFDSVNVHLQQLCQCCCSVAVWVESGLNTEYISRAEVHEQSSWVNAVSLCLNTHQEAQSGALHAPWQCVTVFVRATLAAAAERKNQGNFSENCVLSSLCQHSDWSVTSAQTQDVWAQQSNIWTESGSSFSLCQRNEWVSTNTNTPRGSADQNLLRTDVCGDETAAMLQRFDAVGSDKKGTAASREVRILTHPRWNPPRWSHDTFWIRLTS